MLVKTLLLSLIYLNLASSAFSSGKVCQNADSLSTHNPNDVEWTLLFMAEATNGVYRDPTRAIEILSVICDGNRVIPEVRWRASSPSQKVVSIRSSLFIYKIPFTAIESFLFVDGKINNDLKINSYEVPGNVKTIGITYKIHYPNGQQSEMRRITSMTIQEGEFIFD
jgi:hypothetical protein